MTDAKPFENEEEMERDADSSENEPEVATDHQKLKKKKKNKRKKKATSSLNDPALTVKTRPGLDNSQFRLLGDWKERDTAQTEPPTVPISKLFPNNQFPQGEIAVCSIQKKNSAEMRQLALSEEEVQGMRRAAECHREVRRYAQSYIKPGIKMIDICQKLEAKTLELIEAKGLESGWGFPTGVSLNNCAAHYTPNYGDKTVLQSEDIMKVDFGTHVGGRIIDSAFTIAFDEKFDTLIKATQDGTNAGLKAAGVDVRLTDVGEVIEEAITAYEFDPMNGGKVLPIKPIRNLHGHLIAPYQIHAGKSVPIVKNGDNTRMEEFEVYAIETFASTGKGYVSSDMECSHYKKDTTVGHVPLRLKGSKSLLHCITENFGSLPFCRRWLDDLGQERHLLSLRALCEAELVSSYPPLCDVKGSYTSQMEHTVVLFPDTKEIISRGDDY